MLLIQLCRSVSPTEFTCGCGTWLFSVASTYRCPLPSVPPRQACKSASSQISDLSRPEEEGEAGEEVVKKTASVEVCQNSLYLTEEVSL